MLATAFALLKGSFDDSDYGDNAEGTSHDGFENGLEDNFGSLDIETTCSQALALTGKFQL